MLVISKQDIEHYPLSSQGKISFDGKTLTKGADFSIKLRDAAIAYCQKYRDAGIFCLLVEDKIQLTVWIESVEPVEKSNASESQTETDRLPTSSLQISKEKLDRLVTKMRDRVFGLDIKDRWYNLKVYPRCFIGSDAVKWLMKNQKLTKEEAIRAGQILVDRRIIHHVLDEHQFEDGHLFYRFYMDEQ
jgi:hypothetical protein